MISADFLFADDDQVSQSSDAMKSNEDWNFIGTVLAPLGLTVVVVEISEPDAKLKFSRLTMPRLKKPVEDETPETATLNQELQAEELGRMDEIRYGGREMQWVFHLNSRRLAEGLQWLKRKLESLGILDKAKISHADAEAKVWRMFHPGIEAQP